MACKTQDRLLASAMKIFAEKGYAHTTIGEICEAAEANIAAVNYHFGDKEKFYEAVWRSALKTANDEFPVSMPEGEDHTPEEELRHFIAQFMRQSLSEGDVGTFCKIMLREMVEPTHALEQIHQEVLAKRGAVALRILDKLLGPDVPEKHLRMCRYSLISQCVFLNFNSKIRDRLLHCSECREDWIDDLTAHIYRVIIATVRDIRNEFEGKADES